MRDVFAAILLLEEALDGRAEPDFFECVGVEVTDFDCQSVKIDRCRKRQARWTCECSAGHRERSSTGGAFLCAAATQTWSHDAFVSKHRKNQKPRIVPKKGPTSATLWEKRSRRIFPSSVWRRLSRGGWLFAKNTLMSGCYSWPIGVHRTRRTPIRRSCLCGTLLRDGLRGR